MKRTPQQSNLSKDNAPLAPVVKRSCSRTTEFRHNPELRAETLDINKNLMWSLFKEKTIMERRHTVDAGLQIIKEHMGSLDLEEVLRIIKLKRKITTLEENLTTPDMNDIFDPDEWDDYYLEKAIIHDKELKMYEMMDRKQFWYNTQYKIVNIQLNRSFQ